jgi:hypothetical protein
MHAAVRAFPGHDPAFRRLCARVEVGLSPQLERLPGFRLHLAACCADRLCLSLLVFDREAQLLAALEVAREWGRVHLADLVNESRPTEMLLGESLLAFMRPKPPPR